MTERPEPRLRRLADAVDVYLAQGRSPTADMESVLAANHGLRDLLEPMLKAPSAADQGLEVTRADRLGDFRMLREIGRGGMGVVYEAEELSLGRRVALKVLPNHFTLNPRSIERFRREAAAVARLKHPGIVPIYRVGEVAGTHFFAMEFVEGTSLGQILERVRRELAADPGAEPRLGLPAAASPMAEVAEIVAQAAEALAAAHEQGVVHRDVKPHNILLQHDGRVRVVDFGLAKDLERGSVSRSGDVAGTPHYMSPEQALGRRDVDGRTDVFALGVVLYELMTLALPFDGDSPQHVLSAILARDPAPPRTRNSRVPRDLEVICLKALEKDLRHRYPSCSALAADLRRFLRLEPIEARAPGSMTRVMKMVRRHKAASLALLFGAVLAVGGPVAYVVMQQQAHASVVAQEAETRKQRDLAQANFARARRLVEQQLARVEQLAREPGMELLHRQMAEDALAYYEEFLSQDLIDSAIWRQALGTGILVGRIRMQLGELDKARAAFAESFTRAVAARRVHPDDGQLVVVELDAAAALAACQLTQGDVATGLATFVSAEKTAEESLKCATGAAREEVAAAYARLLVQRATSSMERREDTARATAALARASELWEEAPNLRQAPESQLGLLDLAMLRGRALRISGDFAAAEAIVTAAVTRADALVAAQPDDPVACTAAARVVGELAAVLARLSDDARTVETYRRAIALRERLVADFPRQIAHRFGLQSALVNLAQFYLFRGRHAEAMEHAERAWALIVELADANPGDVQFARERLMVEKTVALIGLWLWKPDEIVARYARTITHAREMLVRFPESLRVQSVFGAILSNLAMWRVHRGENALAAELLDEACEHQRIAIAKDPEQAETKTFLKNHLRLLSDARLGLREYDASLVAARAMLPLDDGLGSRLDVAYRLVRVGLAKGLVPGDPPGTLDGSTADDFYAEPAALVVDVLARDPARAKTILESEELRRLEARSDVRAALARAQGGQR